LIIEVRLLGPGDLAVLERVAPDVFDGPIRPNRAAEFLADPRHHLAVALAGGEVVGFASGVHYVHPDKEPELWIAEVGVSPAHRRGGLATRLLGRLKALARELGCTQLWVLTERGNAAAVSLYHGSGGRESDDEAVLFSWQVS
jgi:aminoglycoside 6'-N-acetyltransferase I